VLEADRGLLALRLVKEHTPDLIVLDAMLPEVHGFEIARRIKGSRRYGHVPIIMVSAVYRGWRYAEDLKQNFGVDEFIEKPFRIADVVAKVEECLARKDKRGSAEAVAPGVASADEGNGLSSEAERALSEGVAAYQAGRIDEAVAHLRRGIGIDPLAFRLHFHLGLLFGRKGEVFDAISELETAVSLNGHQKSRHPLSESRFPSQSRRNVGAGSRPCSRRRDAVIHQGASAQAALTGRRARGLDEVPLPQL
jgi:DNA-binding response OmpR family regulator